MLPLLGSTPLEADVVFVHGLRGGPFLTWRQEGPLEPTSHKRKKTDCWPKVSGILYRLSNNSYVQDKVLLPLLLSI